MTPASPGSPSTLARSLHIAFAAPVGLLVVLGVILGRQVQSLVEDGQAVAHSQQVLGVAQHALRQVSDQEIGARSYLLTHDPRFLASFDRATPRTSFDRLQRLTADNPAQQARLDGARERYEGWLAAVAPSLQAGTASADAMARDTLRMDGVRDAMSEAIDREDALLRSRADSLAASTTGTGVLFVGLLTASAALLAWLSRRQLRVQASAFQATIESEHQAREVAEREEWIREGLARLVQALQGELTLAQLGSDALVVLAPYARADVGAFFTPEDGGWRRRAGYGLDARAAGPESFAGGEGLVGQVAAEGALRHVRQAPAEAPRVRAGTADLAPVELVLIPARLEGVTHAVLELGFLQPVSARAAALLDRIGQTLAFAVRSSEYKHQQRELLAESQQQSEELRTQQEELRVANEELEVQTAALRKTQALHEQTNDQLVLQSSLLERQNERLTESQSELEAKAREVEQASQFKTDFLSNMSHELRTPLNSSLILSKLLADNREGNLTDEQVRSAATIYAAGNDLLALINDILDLSKIEAGKMDVHVAPLGLDQVRATLLRTFEPLAQAKALGLVVRIEPSAEGALDTDAQRLEQILKNLVSNAVKFTAQGEVTIVISGSDDTLRFAVRDTGIGIPPEHRGVIFEAFRQADGTTSRMYGGSGLGLSISRELARLLGGDLSVDSEVGQGSTFALSLPRRYGGPLSALPAPPRPRSDHPPASEPPASRSAASLAASLAPGQRLLLVVEDDASFARIVADVAREMGFACLLADTAQQGLALARKHLPAGIVLDLGLPDHTGLSVLDRLKRDPQTRHIPVHIVSAHDRTGRALAMGAAAYLQKPVDRDRLVEALRSIEDRASRRVRRVLVVDDDATLRQSVASLLGRDDIEIHTAATVAEALTMLRTRSFDCLVTDLGFPAQSGYELLETIASGEPYSVPPVIVYTGRDLRHDEEQRLQRYSRSIIIKGARSPERLLDEVTLFLHQVESELPSEQQTLLKRARHHEALFEKRTILVVEDDVRNVFALNNVIEPRGARVVIARNGREALEALEREPVIDLVLMDVMMPEMDGLEATRAIRQNPRHARLPIVMLTAKAMPDDQRRCLEAGASDYLTKPLDVEMLLSLLRVWMPRVTA